MCRRLPVAVAIAVGLVANSLPAFSAEPADVFGDPLPAGAVARAGTLRAASDLPAGFELPSSVRGVVFSPDGELLATRGEPADPSAARVIRLWDAATGKLLRTIAALDRPLAWLEFSADSRRLISATPDHPQGTQVWNVADGKLLQSLPAGRGRFFLSADGRAVSLVERFQKNDVIRTFDLAGGAEVGRSMIETSHRFEFSPTGGKLLAQNSERSTVLALLDMATGKPRAKLDGREGPPGAMAFSADGRTVAVAARSASVAACPKSTDTSGDACATVVMWEIAAERPVFVLAGHAEPVLALCFSSDGRCLASGSADGTVRIWEVATGKEIHTFAGHRGPVSTVDISPDGARLASGSFDRTVLVWDLNAVKKSFLPEQPLDADTFDRAWDELAAISPSNAYRAIGRLRQHEQAAAALLHERIESIVRPVQSERIGELIAELEHADYVIRFRATEQLQKLREIARPLLLKAAAETTSAEVRYRLRRILTGSEETPRFSAADVRRIARVIHVLEHLPGERAEATLQAIIDDFPSEEVAAEARETLARLRARSKPAD